MSGKRTAVVLWIFVCSAGMAMGQTVWEQYPDNPVIGPGPPGGWDATGHMVNAVVFDGSTYHMWMNGWDPDNQISDIGIGHATSPDGVEWTMDPANPVLTPGANGEWDEYYFGGGGVIHDGTQFNMWYGGWQEGIYRAGYATSPDGSVWTKNPGNPVMDVGPPGSWDAVSVFPDAVIVDGETYKMWYLGEDETAEWRIGYAESSDGIHWTKRPEPVLERENYPGVWDADGAFWWGFSVVFDGSAYHGWYTGIEGNVGAISYAYSNDGIEWTKHRDNPVVQGSEGQAYVPKVISDGSTWHMWYSDFYDSVDWVFYATSDCCAGVAGLTHMLTIPAAALASGAQGSFYQTDVDLNNAGSQASEYQFTWLPRGENNSEPVTSESFTLGAGMSVRYANVLAEVFDLEPNALGAFLILSSSPDLLCMSRTYNLETAKSGGTFGQAIPAIKPGEFIERGERRRILFGSQSEDYRTNVGCVNGTDMLGAVEIELFNAEGTSLKTERLRLDPWSNDQINAIFSDYAPVNGYVDVWTMLPNGEFFCYGSVLDNVTSDPTTILPQ